MSLIRLEDVSLVFQVRRHRKIPLKEFLIHRMFRKSVNPLMEVRAINNVSLDFHEGERVGIIGHNGAGKSTMLKMLAGIYAPTSGQRIVRGRISSLFDISLGFAADSSGWDNIELRGYLQGETPQSIREKREEIAEFSELREFLDTPIRYYSSGMSVRLAFAICTTIEPDILLMDEVLAAGDLSFQKKAQERLERLIDRARLMVIVSHDIGAIETLCNRVIWMDHGSVRMDGEPEEVIEAYSQCMAGVSHKQAAA